MEKIAQKKNTEASRLGILLIVLFGSRAEKKARSDSDFDVAVLMEEKKSITDFERYSAVLSFLSETLKIPSEKIDLTKINGANPLLQKEIFSKGQLLFGNEILFEEYRAVAFREYLDASKLFETESKIITKRFQLLKQLI